MIILIIVAAVAIGVCATLLLWPYGAIIALIGAPVAASLAALLGAVILASRKPQTGNEPHGVTHALMQILGRRNQR